MVPARREGIGKTKATGSLAMGRNFEIHLKGLSFPGSPLPARIQIYFEKVQFILLYVNLGHNSSSPFSLK
jgi:hypothetical protein